MTDEFNKLQSFINQHHKDKVEMEKMVEKYKKSIEISTNNYLTYLHNRQKYVIANINMFLESLTKKYGEVTIKFITFYNDKDRVLRIKFLQNNKLKIADYYAEQGWTSQSENSEV